MMNLRLFLCLTLTLSLWLNTAQPSVAAIPDNIPSQFMTLSASQQDAPEALKSLYRQVVGQWQVLRLDPDVPDEEIRQRLDFVSSSLQRVEDIRKKVSAGEDSKKISNYLDPAEQKELLLNC